MKETGDISKSQYSGTKTSWCTKCFKNLNNLTREQQDIHEKTCLDQRRLDNFT
jgi:hypothetical protein